MKIAIITVAGISSRFNRDVPEEEKTLKCIYWEDDPKNTLIYQLLNKVSSYDRIIVVGGFKFDDLESYLSKNASPELNEKIALCGNDHYDDLSSGYSLYLGVKEALSYDDVDEILFVEGDLDIDDESFSNVINSQKNVITYNREPIYSNKAVVLYQNENDDYKYLFNSDHGLLAMDEPFKAMDEALKERVLRVTAQSLDNTALLLITHSEREAYALGCRVLRYEDGRFI